MYRVGEVYGIAVYCVGACFIGLLCIAWERFAAPVDLFELQVFTPFTPYFPLVGKVSKGTIKEGKPAQVFSP